VLLALPWLLIPDEPSNGLDPEASFARAVEGQVRRIVDGALVGDPAGPGSD
jgi:ABC-type molybdenum transport system ATPase subunit/photorepair protein PhrA